MSRFLSLALLAATAAPGAARAHDASDHAVENLWQAYTLDPLVLAPMVIFATCYLAGLARLWRRAGFGRGLEWWRPACFAGGIMALTLALVWPFDSLARFSFAMHMAQHVMLTLVAAPLLVASAPILTLLWALPPAWRRGLGAHGHNNPLLLRGRTFLFTPVLAWAFYASMLWSWHMPLLYEAAVLNSWIHILEHLCFFAAGLVLWWTVLLSARGPTFGLGAGVFLLFGTGLQDGLLGAVLTFASRPLYSVYDSGTLPLGLGPLQDQQLAGVLMWLAGGAVYLCGALFLTSLWLSRMERQSPD